jgi:transcriptional regulator with XRE-family HTH domain
MDTAVAPSLQEMRTRKGLSQSAIGSKPMIVAIEAGRRMPGPALLRRMAEAMGEAPEAVYAACEQSHALARAAARFARRPRQGAAP